MARSAFSNEPIKAVELVVVDDSVYKQNQPITSSSYHNICILSHISDMYLTQILEI